jgi:hypothetical protein
MYPVCCSVKLPTVAFAAHSTARDAESVHIGFKLNLFLTRILLNTLKWIAWCMYCLLQSFETLHVRIHMLSIIVCDTKHRLTVRP